MAAALCFWAGVITAAPTINITSPTSGITVTFNGSNVVNFVLSAQSTSPLNGLSFYCNGTLIKQFTLPPGLTSLSGTIPVLLAAPSVDSFTATVSDTSGGSATSAAVIVDASSSTAGAPTNGLVLWLRGDTVQTDGSGAITNWVDASGLGNDAAQPSTANAPTLTTNVIQGKSVARFDVLDTGTPRYMLVPNSPSISNLNTNFTVLVVACEFDEGRPYAIISKTSGSSQPNPLFFHWNVGGLSGMDLGDGNGITASGTNTTRIASPNFGVIAARVGNNVIEGNVNLVPQPTATIGGAAVVDGGNPLNIGQGLTDPVLYTGFYGNMAEILLYSNRLSNLEYGQAQVYLATKYGLPASFAQLGPVPISVTYNGLTNGQTVTTNISVSVSVTSSNPVASVSYFANGALVGTSLGIGSTNFQTVIRSTPGTLSLKVVATDILGLQASSATIFVTVNGASLVTAPPTAGLVLWLKPDVGMITNSDGSGTIAEWDDQSGLGNNAFADSSATAPFYITNTASGYPAAHFDQAANGNNPQYLSVADAPSLESFTNNFTIFAVVNPIGTSGASDIISKASISASFAYPFEWHLNSGLPLELDLAAGGATTAFNISSFSLGANTPNVVAAEVGGGTITQYAGYTTGNSSILGNADVQDGSGPLYIGNRPVQDRTMRGDISEVLCYNTALSASDRQQVIDYLVYKHRVAYASLAGSKPVVSILSPTNGLNVAPGDSVTLNVAASTANVGSSLVTLGFYANGVLFDTAAVSGTNLTLPYIMQPQTIGNYAITVVATDNLGLKTTSDPVLISANYALVPTNAPTNGLVLWLRADAGTVVADDGISITNWLDQSGFGNNAVQTNVANAPELTANILQSLPAARFNVLETGAPRYLLVQNSPSLSNLTKNFTFLVVATTFDQGRPYAIMSKTSGSLQPNPFFWHWNGGGGSGIDLGDGTAITATENASTTVPGSAFGLLAVRAGNNVVQESVNLIKQPAVSIASTSISDNGGVLNIGQGITLPYQYTGMYGYITELLVYSNALSDSDYVLAQSYLALKYGLSTPTISGPAKGSPQLAVAAGAPNVTLSWPLNYSGFILENSTNLLGPWTPIATNPPNSQVQQNVGTGGVGPRFFRLRQ